MTRAKLIKDFLTATMFNDDTPEVNVYTLKQAFGEGSEKYNDLYKKYTDFYEFDFLSFCVGLPEEDLEKIIATVLE